MADDMSADGGPTILTPTSELDVFRQAQLHALRTLGDQQAITGRAMEKMADAVVSLREDVAALKAQNVAEAVRTLDTKMEAQAQAMAAALAAHTADMDRRLAERDREQARLLGESLTDRKNLWLAITDLKGKVIPLFALLSAGLAALVAVAVEKLTSP